MNQYNIYWKYHHKSYDDRIITNFNRPDNWSEFLNWYSTLPLWKKRKVENNCTLSLDKKINKIKRKKEKKEFQKASIKDVLKILNACFLTNKNVKKQAYSYEVDNSYESGIYTIVDYNLRNNLYNKKSKMIGKAIKWIKDNKLPVKYGKNKGVVYFTYLGHQVSFHDPYNVIHCKKYNGVWSGIINKKIPFIIKK